MVSQIWGGEPVVKAVEGGAQPLAVESIGNHIYFYSDVVPERCLELIHALRNVDSQLRVEAATRGAKEATPIWLHIHSYGGYLASGFGVANAIELLDSPIYSVIEGMCASAATIVSMACGKRFITADSFMLIHQLSSWSFGTYEQLKDDMTINDLMMNRLYAFYAKRSNLSKREVKKLLKRDSWFNAKGARKSGLIDKVLK